MDQLAGSCAKTGRTWGLAGSGHQSPYLGMRALPRVEAAPACLGCQQETLSVAAGDTLEGLGWLHSYWESRGLQHGGSSKAAE